MNARRIEHVVVINDRSSMVGGASNLAVLLAQGLHGRGIATTFFAGDQPADEPPVPDTIHLKGRPLTDRSKLGAFSDGLYNKAAYRSLSALIRAGDTPGTVYHVHGWSKILSPSIFRALASVRARTILHAHDYFLACPNGGFVNYTSASVCGLTPMSAACMTTQCDKRGRVQKLWRVARHALREQLFPVRGAAANIICIHPGMKSYFDRAGIAFDRVRTIRNPISSFLNAPSRPWENKPFFFIGRLEPEKGFEDAAQAAERAGVPLHVIGDGPGRAVLAEKYPDVVVHGWKTKDQMRPLLETARAVVISSRVPEPFGLVAVEAVASGLPVIVPDVALLADELTCQGMGLSFRSGDIGSLAKAMTRLAGDDVLLRFLHERGLASGAALAETPESWIKAMLETYAGVIGAAVQADLPQRHPSYPSPQHKRNRTAATPLGVDPTK